MSTGDHTAASAPSPGRVASQLHWRDAPFVGRASERRALDVATRRLAQGTGGLVIVEGIAGVGKSRLVSHVLDDRANAERFDRREVTASPFGGDRPFGPLLDVLGLRWRDVVPSTPTTTVDYQLPNLPRFLIREAVIDAIERLSTRPTVLVIHDLHWADDDTVALVAEVPRLLAESRALVVVTTRPEPRVVVASALAAQGGGQVVQIGPLTDAEALRVLTSAGFEGDSQARASALAVAGGNPLLLQVAAAGASPQDDLIGGIVAASLSTMSADDRDVVQAAAVLGLVIEPREVAAMCGVEPVQVVDLCESPAANSLVDESGAGFRFRHDLLRDAVLSKCGRARLALLHQRATETLWSMRASPLRIAEHALRGGLDRHTRIDLLELAESVARADPIAALRLSEAIQVAGPAPTAEGAFGAGDPDRAERLALIRVQCMVATGRANEAGKQIEQLLSAPVEPAREAMLRRELGVAAIVAGDAARASAEMRRVGELVGTDQARGRALAELANCQLVMRDPHGARANAEIAQQLATSSPDAVTDVAATQVLVMCGLMSGDLDGATRAFERMQQSIEVYGIGEGAVYQPHLFITMFLADTGQFEAALASARAGLDAAQRHGHLWAVSVYDAYLAQLLLHLGNLADARAHAAAAVDGAERFDPFCVGAWGLGVLARVAVLTGHDDVAALAAQIQTKLDEGTFGMGFESAALGLATARAASGAIADGRACVDVGVAILESLPAWPAISTMTSLWARLARDAGDQAGLDAALELARSVHDRLGLPVSAARLAAAEAIHTGSASDLVRACERLHEASLPVEAYELAVDGARTTRGNGELRQLAHDLAALLALSTPKRASQRRAVTGLAALTPAERDVARLIADGRSNPDIAAELVLSRRTVESHVNAIYRKIGERSRVQVARLVLAQR